MRKLASLLLLAVGLLGLGGGCATPAYTGGENLARVGTAMSFDLQQSAEDFYNESMLFPSSHMTRWNLR